jgi:hypothetical protein
VNNLGDAHYTYYVAYQGNGQNGAPNAAIRQGIQSGVFDCLGYLYETHGMGNGKALYCPSYPETSLLSAANYSNPSFLSTDVNGEVRGTMLYNPHIVDPTNGVVKRLFQKTGSIVPSKLFGCDYLAEPVSDLNGGATITAYSPNYFAHFPSPGFDCLFTDGSVQFVQSVPAFNYISQGVLVTAESIPSYESYMQLYNWLENSN